jgi:hypothetical protein
MMVAEVRRSLPQPAAKECQRESEHREPVIGARVRWRWRGGGCDASWYGESRPRVKSEYRVWLKAFRCTFVTQSKEVWIWQPEP